MSSYNHQQTIRVYRCPKCAHEVEQKLFGTPHTSSIACIDCEVDMETIGLDESKYDYADELIENDGRYEVKFDRPSPKEDN